MTAQDAAAALGTSVAWVYRNKKALRAFQACPRGAVLIPDKVVQSILDGTYALEQAANDSAQFSQGEASYSKHGFPPLPHSARRKKKRTPEDDPFGLVSGCKR